jgi:hypothetical protein
MIDRRSNSLCCRTAAARMVAAALASTLVGLGCGGSDKVGGAKAPGAGVAESHAEGLTHEPCGESVGHVESIDANGDGKPDIRVVTDKGRERCRVVDLDHDGKPDLYEYFDSSGAIRRREFCYDETGAVNAVETYEGGKLVHREYDISGHHKIDTWDWFDPNAPVDPKTGRPAHPIRRERDTTGRGQIDQWWTWNGDRVTIAFDRTGDGRPDPATAVVLGPDGNPVTTAPSGSSAPGGSASPPAAAAPPPSSPPTAASVDGGQS